MRKALSAVAAAWLLCGCIASPPPRHDVGFSAGQPVTYPTLTAAWVPSDNTKEMRPYITKWLGYLSTFGSDVSSDQVESEVSSALKRSFRSAVRADSPAEALALKTNLVALVDVYADLPKNVFGTARISVKVQFIDPAQRPVEEIAVESIKKVNEVTPFGLGDGRLKKTLLIAADDAAEQLAAAVRSSAKLAEASRAAPSGEAPVAATPAKIYRSEVDVPSYTAAEDERAFALVVGVEKYQALPDAQFAARDAESIHRHLKALGYPERNILFLSDQRALKSAIEKYVESWLPAHVDASSRVFVYFSGHGAPDVSSKQAYLMPWDGDPKFLAQTGYPVKRLYEKLNALKARQVLVALDSCFSGAGGRSVIQEGLRPLVTNVDPGSLDIGKLTVLAATGADEVTGTAAAEGHGLFTYYLLKALNHNEGRGTVKSVYDFLRPKVQDAARVDNRDQTPQLLGARAERAEF